MNKLLISLALVFSLSISSLTAVESSMKLNQADSEFLFGTNVQNINAIVLSEDEMEETTGEGFLFGIGLGIGVWGLNCIFNKSCKDIKFPFKGKF